MNYELMKNEELAFASQNGDDNATSALLYRFKDMVKTLSRSFFLVGADYEDLIQEGMIGLYKAIQVYSPDRAASFKTFAIICIRGQLQDAIKSANRKKHKFLNDYISLYSSVHDEDDDGKEYIDTVKSEELGPEEKLLQDESSKAFYSVVNSTFNKQELEILRLYLKGDSYEVIAAEVGITTKKVDNTLSKIRRNLSKILN
ncbi:MAG: sigma-70 family RNA polymerase sigma factor [Clostridia bacterium]|nr:sigma-70 family RNA polymerase sigma factor [Clostridia bacterium]